MSGSFLKILIVEIMMILIWPAVFCRYCHLAGRVKIKFEALVTDDCERLFSKLGYIKTADRNRLGDILNDILFVYDVTDKEQDTIDVLDISQTLAKSWDYDKMNKTPWSERYGVSIV